MLDLLLLPLPPLLLRVLWGSALSCYHTHETYSHLIHAHAASVSETFSLLCFAFYHQGDMRPGGLVCWVCMFRWLCYSLTAHYGQGYYRNVAWPPELNNTPTGP